MENLIDIFTQWPIEIIDWSSSYLMSVKWYYVYLFVILILWIENVFPPMPSDSIVLFTGSLISFGSVTYLPLVLAATIGSTIGFITMYSIGKKFDEKIIDSGKFSFISEASINKAERWFNRYGYYLIVANRFIAAIRAVISFFAGMSNLNYKKTVYLSIISSFAWYAILIYMGYVFGDNLDYVKSIIKSYGQIIFPIILVVIIVLIVKWRNGSKN